MLAVASRHVSSCEPQARTLLYLDDRTIVAQNKTALLNAIDAWDLLFSITRLRNNPRKEQYWGRTMDAFVDFIQTHPKAGTTASVLGASVGVVPRSKTAEEDKRQKQVQYVAQRLAVLRVSQKLKTAVAASILTGKQTWGILFNARAPTVSECDFFAKMWRGAVQGFDHMGGHDSRNLSAIFRFGHTSDLLCISAQRFMSALHKWSSNKPPGWQLPQTPAIVALHKVALRPGCAWSGSSLTFDQDAWSISMPLINRDRCAHNLRQFWRRNQFEAWLQSSRRDAVIARAAGITTCGVLIDALRSFAKQATAHQCAVICGGLTTAAHFYNGGPGLRDYCPDCEGAVCPATNHVYWYCSSWNALRNIPAPEDDALVLRLGWNAAGPQPTIITQMASVRAAHARAARKRRVGEGGGGVLSLRSQRRLNGRLLWAAKPCQLAALHLRTFGSWSRQNLHHAFARGKSKSLNHRVLGTFFEVQSAFRVASAGISTQHPHKNH